MVEVLWAENDLGVIEQCNIMSQAWRARSSMFSLTFYLVILTILRRPFPKFDIHLQLLASDAGFLLANSVTY